MNASTYQWRINFSPRSSALTIARASQFTLSVWANFKDVRLLFSLSLYMQNTHTHSENCVAVKHEWNRWANLGPANFPIDWIKFRFIYIFFFLAIPLPLLYCARLLGRNKFSNLFVVNRVEVCHAPAYHNNKMNKYIRATFATTTTMSYQ